MTKQQAESVVASVKTNGVDVREHPDCNGGKNPWYYAVCGNKNALANHLVSAAIDKARSATVDLGIGYKIDTAPAWATDASFAIY